MPTPSPRSPIPAWKTMLLWHSSSQLNPHCKPIIQCFRSSGSGGHFMKLVITANLSFTDYYHGNSQWQCFIANQNQECHCTCQWMTHCQWWQVSWNAPQVLMKFVWFQTWGWGVCAIVDHNVSTMHLAGLSMHLNLEWVIPWAAHWRTILGWLLVCDHIGWQCSESAEGGSEGIIQLKR